MDRRFRLFRNSSAQAARGLLRVRLYRIRGGTRTDSARAIVPDDAQGDTSGIEVTYPRLFLPMSEFLDLRMARCWREGRPATGSDANALAQGCWNATQPCNAGGARLARGGGASIFSCPLTKKRESPPTEGMNDVG